MLIGLLALVVTGSLLMVLIGTVAVAHDNPPVTHTIQWDSPQTEALARRACFDCHSHETVWPWYSYVAPVAFLVAHDVDEGREEMNFSTGYKLNGGEMAEQIEDGEMPPRIYLPPHPEANLTAQEKETLIAGLIATFGGERGGDRGDNDDDGDDD
jgi:hypothetical protein